MTTSEVTQRYADRKANPRQGNTVTWGSGNVFCRDRTIFSFGSHFPMALYLGEKAGAPVFLRNGDRYSSTTSGHQGNVRRLCPGFTIPFSALRAANFEADYIKLADVLDRTEDETIYLKRETKDAPWTLEDGAEFVRPVIGALTVSRFANTGFPEEGLTGYWHAPGSVLLRNEKRRLLATSDEGTYCIMELGGRPVATLARAFQELKPVAVTAAESAGLTVLRQGEWYFVPCDPPKGRSAAKQAALPRREDAGNLHVCRMLETPKALYCTGKVYHRTREGIRSRQHRALRLAGWHRAYRNTERASWSASGRVD